MLHQPAELNRAAWHASHACALLHACSGRLMGMYEARSLSRREVPVSVDLSCTISYVVAFLHDAPKSIRLPSRCRPCRLVMHASNGHFYSIALSR